MKVKFIIGALFLGLFLSVVTNVHADNLFSNADFSNGVNGCFLAGTQITMADGTKKLIEEIKLGDVVLAFDEETGEMKPDKVVQIFEHNKEDKYLIINEHMRVTPIHRVLSKGEWIEIGKLNVGDTLTDANGKDVEIESIEFINEPVNIYNFEVNPYHTYVADGFIVHNRKLNVVAADPWGGEGDR